MKIKLITFLLFAGCSGTKLTENNGDTKKNENDSLKQVIKELKAEINDCQDEVRFKEREVSYWGRKYDSLINIKK